MHIIKRTTFYCTCTFFFINGERIQFCFPFGKWASIWGHTVTVCHTATDHNCRWCARPPISQCAITFAFLSLSLSLSLARREIIKMDRRVERARSNTRWDKPQIDQPRASYKLLYIQKEKRNWKMHEEDAHMYVCIKTRSSLRWVIDIWSTMCCIIFIFGQE
jgi:hypothetical protein